MIWVLHFLMPLISSMDIKNKEVLVLIPVAHRNELFVMMNLRHLFGKSLVIIVIYIGVYPQQFTRLKKVHVIFIHPTVNILHTHSIAPNTFDCTQHIRLHPTHSITPNAFDCTQRISAAAKCFLTLFPNFVQQKHIQ